MTCFGIRILLFLILFLLIFQHSMEISFSGCHSDRDKDHLPRVSCVSRGVAAVPDGIDPGTQVLVLSHNAFVSLSWSSYTTFTQLQELDLSQNNISTIDPSGPVLKYLRVLRLSENRLMALGRAAFNSTPSLTEVYLDGNSISSIHTATFSDLPLLELINLSRNKLHLLPTHLLQHISSRNLKNFDLEDNRVQHLPDSFFASKPDIPYVFLSKNPWVCTCQVSYLQQYLEDQSHNIYTHTGPSSIENDPESVQCSAPLTLQGRAIVDLKEEEYCASDTDPQHPTTHTPPTTPDTIVQSDIRKTPPPTTTTTTPTTIQPTSPIPVETSTASLTTSTTENPTTNKPSTTPTITMTTIPTTTPTTTPITPTTTTSSTTQTSIQPTTPTFSTPNITESSSAPLQCTLTTDNPPAVQAVTLRGEEVGAARGGAQRSVIWCWWLFITGFLLCFFSAIFASGIFLWLIIIYIRLYRPIKRQVHGGQRVTLRAYQVTADQSPAVDTTQAERAAFLPAEMIRENQPVFRSVLFISKGAEDGKADERNEGTRETGSDAVTKLELLPAVTLHREQTDNKDKEEVFRKTFHRLISREEEIEGWGEVEMIERETDREEEGVTRIKTRYSLILREKRGSVTEERKGETEWLLGEWEMRGGCGLSDSAHMIKPETETSV